MDPVEDLVFGSSIRGRAAIIIVLMRRRSARTQNLTVAIYPKSSSADRVVVTLRLGAVVEATAVVELIRAV